jgi:hypothetical protein
VSLRVRKPSYRNPCNIPGSKKQTQETCGALSVPGFFTCSYCAGANDKKLLGQGMGCQLSTLEWPVPAECRPVNNKSVPKSSIFEMKTKTNCQCSNTQYSCARAVQDRTAGYVPRFK